MPGDLGLGLGRPRETAFDLERARINHLRPIVVQPFDGQFPLRTHGIEGWNFLAVTDGENWMEKSRPGDAQMLAVLKQAENGAPVPVLCREHGMSGAWFCT